MYVRAYVFIVKTLCNGHHQLLMEIDIIMVLIFDLEFRSCILCIENSSTVGPYGTAQF